MASLGQRIIEKKQFAEDKTCKNCGVQNHFSCVCRKPKSTSQKTTRPKVNSIDENTTDNSDNAMLNTNYNPECESDYDSSDDTMVASIACNTLQIERKNISTNWKYKGGFLIDSRNECSILNESVFTEITNNDSLARWLITAPSKEHKTFANEPIPLSA